MTTEVDWKLEIAMTFLTKKAVFERDRDSLYKFRYPHVCATEEEIKSAEMAIGARFPQSMRNFFLHADGWDGLAVGNADLFSTSDYMGTRRYKNAIEEIYKLNREKVFDDICKNVSKLIPISSSEETIDMYILIISSDKNNGMILWYAGEIIDKYINFVEFYRSMRAYDERHLSKLQNLY